MANTERPVELYVYDLSQGELIKYPGAPHNRADLVIRDG
jgi:hypothetical protein